MGAVELLHLGGSPAERLVLGGVACAGMSMPRVRADRPMVHRRLGASHCLWHRILASLGRKTGGVSSTYRVCFQFLVVWCFDRGPGALL